MRRFLLCLCVCVAPACAAEPYSAVVDYLSPVDGSRQAYGIYVPDREAPEGGYPVVLHAHGYGWSVSAGFSQWQKDWADAHGWILVQLNARGPNFYWGIGDVATREVIDDLATRFGADRTRIYITGGSMGGTGAFRQGVVHPDYIACAAGVDGWTHYGEWHWHWYARKDQRDDIEEFRRPLLEASSPFFLAERALWGDVYVIADGRDDVVYPWQGIELANRLLDLGIDEPGLYSSGLTLHYDKGHGGGYNIEWIYKYFLGKTTADDPSHFVISTTVLDHGELYWARMERQAIAGDKSLLECWTDEEPEREVVAALGGLRSLDASTAWAPDLGSSGRLPNTPSSREYADTPVGVVNVSTVNLDAFSLNLHASDVHELGRVAVFADGIPCYLGPVEILRCEAVRDDLGRLTGWLAIPGDPSSLADADGPPVKSPEICGPFGHAFVTPYVVCYGTAGSDEDVAVHRAEAEAFCKGWNDFMVHGPGLTAIPEDELSPEDLQARNVIVYGTLDSSRLLQRAHSVWPLPVQVRADSVLVIDPLTGDREYRGRKYGVFAVYPNPLNRGNTYLAICRGRFATQPGGKDLRGLEFDLEKLYWGYSDYVVFNTDEADLPFVRNVNNKPPVTCYEAGYFVEAGYYDQDWQADRYVTLDRVRAAKPSGARLVHVADVTVAQTRRSVPAMVTNEGDAADPPRSDLPAPVWSAAVRIVDASGKAVRQARVTGEWVGVDADCISRVSLSDGVAWFPYPGSPAEGVAPRFRVLNVMATGAAYDFEADCLGGSSWVSEDGLLALRPDPPRRSVDPESVFTVRAQAANLGKEPAPVQLRFVPPHGEVVGPPAEATLQPGEQRMLSLRWRPDLRAPSGTQTGVLQLLSERSSVARPVRLRFAGRPSIHARIGEMKATDVVAGQPVEIRAPVFNIDPDSPLRLKVACSIVEAGVHFAAAELEIEPGKCAEAVWRGPEAESLEPGRYIARTSILGAPLVSETIEFAVRPAAP